MKTTIKAIKRGVKAALAGPKPQNFQVAGKTVACSHCGSHDFVPYDLEKFASAGVLREQHGLECSVCGHLELFTRSPTEIETGV